MHKVERIELFEVATIGDGNPEHVLQDGQVVDDRKVRLDMTQSNAFVRVSFKGRNELFHLIPMANIKNITFMDNSN